MSLEQEVKFACPDFNRLRSILEENEARFVHRVFEHNRVYDTPGRDLRAEGKLLRLREARQAVLCLKQSPGDAQRTGGVSPRVKTWEETQTQVVDPRSMHSLLLSLGYEVVFAYQKVREKWQAGGCEVCLDRLPFGRYVEIEGEPDRIWAQARALGLSAQKWSGKSYYDLHQEWRAAHRLPPEESFVFGPEEESAIRAEVEKGAGSR
jgi:adenylate cyclase class 2